MTDIRVMQYANPKHQYTMGAQKIAHSTEEKDLGVVINQSLSPSHHIATCVSRANRIVGLIKRTYVNKSKRREQVQRRMTKMINGMGEDEYSVRLLKTKLLSLEMRRLRSDLIEVFKIIAQLRGCETRGLIPATHRHWPKRSLSDHSQTALQTEYAEIFLHTSSSGYLEQAE